MAMLSYRSSKDREQAEEQPLQRGRFVSCGSDGLPIEWIRRGGESGGETIRHLWPALLSFMSKNFTSYYTESFLRLR